MTITRRALVAGLALSAAMSSSTLAQDAQPAAPTAPAAPAPEPAPATAPSASDTQAADIEAIMAHELAQQSAAPKLEFYGFADFMYLQYLISESSPWQKLLPGGGNAQFVGGNLNLYMRGNLAANWTSLAEVRFHFAPAGEQIPETAAILDPTTSDYVDNTSKDPSDYGRSFDYGFIEIERLHIDYTAHPLLNIRAGRFLMPYGVWNVDHGSPVVINVTRPYIVGDALIPEAQTGFEVYGSTNLGALDLGYHLTLSNGRSPIEQVGDLDRNKGIGGRVWMRTNLLTLGGSLYYGHYTDKRFVLKDATTQEVEWSTWERYRELGVGADLELRAGGLQWVSEVIAQQRAWDDDKRGLPGKVLSPDTRSADHVRWGVYSLLGYRFAWGGVMPYAMFQYYDAGNYDAFVAAPKVIAGTVGVNARVAPSVVLKLAITGSDFLDAAKGSPLRDSLWLAGGQIAWAF